MADYAESDDVDFGSEAGYAESDDVAFGAEAEPRSCECGRQPALQRQAHRNPDPYVWRQCSLSARVGCLTVCCY
jgi:hypothetical protein